jgi:hypothetical protein
MTKILLQKRLDEIIKAIITPVLKELGFKKSSRNYYKELVHFGLCFNVQSSIYNDEKEIKFTFNTGIFIPELYEAFFNYDIPKFPKEYECFNRKRIGELMNTSDYWYTISENTNLENLMGLIKNHIYSFVVPYFQSFNKDKDIIDLYNSRADFKVPYDFAILIGFMILYGDKGEGEKLLREHYSNNVNSSYAKTIINYSNKLGIAIEEK